MELNDLYVMADEEDVELLNWKLPQTKAMSHMSLSGNCYVALDARQFDTAAEEKLVLAHELGHCLTGSFYNRYSPYDIRGLHERRADKKAAFLLVPLDELIEAIESPWHSVYDLSEHFGVPEDFMRKVLEIYESELRTAYQSLEGDKI